MKDKKAHPRQKAFPVTLTFLLQSREASQVIKHDVASLTHKIPALLPPHFSLLHFIIRCATQKT